MHRANDTLGYRTRCVHVAVASLPTWGVLSPALHEVLRIPRIGVD
jgi:hypothetical protein